MKNLNKIIREEIYRIIEMTDDEFVIDQLIHNVDDGTLTRKDFIDYISYETKFDKNKLGKLYDTYLKLDGRSRVKLDNPRYAKTFLKKHKII